MSRLVCQFVLARLLIYVYVFFVNCTSVVCLLHLLLFTRCFVFAPSTHMRSLRLRFPARLSLFHATRHALLLYVLAVSALPITLVSGAARARLIDIVQKADIVQGDVGRKGLAQGRVGHMA